MCSPGEAVPGSRDPGSGGLHRLPGGAVWRVTCAHTQASWWRQQQPQRLLPVSGVRADNHGSRPSLEFAQAALRIPSLCAPRNKEARKSLLPPRQLQTPSQTPSQLALKPKPQLPAPARPGGGADKPLGLVSAAPRQASVRESLRFSLCALVAMGSMLIAAARARLWSSFRRSSESPLLEHPETKRQEKVSCLFGSCRRFRTPSRLAVVH